MTTVMVFEAHPAVRAGIVRRLESEERITVLAAHSEPFAFAVDIARFNPDIAVVGTFGSDGIMAARAAATSATATKVVVLDSGLWTDGLRDLPAGVTVVADGPRGDALAAVVRNRAGAESEVAQMSNRFSA